SGDGIGAPKTARGGRQVAVLERPADRRRRHEASGFSETVLDLGDDIDRKSKASPRLDEERRRAGPGLAEMKVPSDDDGADPEPLHQDRPHKLLRAHRGEPGVERQEDEAREAELRAEGGLHLGGRQTEGDGAFGEMVGRVRLERQQGARRAPLLRQGDRPPNHGLMAKMEAVEVSDRVCRSLESGRRTSRIRGANEAILHGVPPILKLKAVKSSQASTWDSAARLKRLDLPRRA